MTPQPIPESKMHKNYNQDDLRAWFDSGARPEVVISESQNNIERVCRAAWLAALASQQAAEAALERWVQSKDYSKINQENERLRELLRQARLSLSTHDLQNTELNSAIDKELEGKK